VELYLHSPNTPSRRGAWFKKAQGQLYLDYCYIRCVRDSQQYASLDSRVHSFLYKTVRTSKFSTLWITQVDGVRFNDDINI
jgi:hypothetical protein